MRSASHIRLLSDAAPTDAELVRDVRAGDARAGHALYRRYSNLVNGLVFRLLGRDSELDDLVQEIFLRVFSRLEDLRHPEALRSWLRAITVRTVRGHLAKRRLRPWLRGGREAIDPERLLSGSAPPDVAAEVRAVYSILDRLSIDERLVIVLRRIEAYSMEEIVEATGLSEATVRRRLASAEKRLEKRTGGAR